MKHNICVCMKAIMFKLMKVLDILRKAFILTSFKV
uniref:Uncharacterized protein n=1 Tax=Anguilla anguilla TaxID=7936 RepID=A0A0E9PJ84_ANGAN